MINQHPSIGIAISFGILVYMYQFVMLFML